MARTSPYTRSELRSRIRDQARRAVTPEQAAGELGVSLSQFRRYLESFGGRIVTNRSIALPLVEELSHECEGAGAAAG